MYIHVLYLFFHISGICIRVVTPRTYKQDGSFNIDAKMSSKKQGTRYEKKINILL